jgi:hypothetical protein
MAQRHHLGGENIHAGQHGGIRAGGGDESAVSIFEQRAALREPVEVRRRLAPVMVAAHVVGSQRIDRDEQNIRLSSPGHSILLL